ncbi:hypothetical protein BDV96DRAFT_655094 [Lophiotrema nucula]|uniref:Uncharacterized protein n=1 Tax=Lophiotrema nucula TaxID=690887 RepID=A0A6A5YHZ0_9PLEO|nr:hypothetical protein BDV96DRAFT_655094 [Lophiotrema nucula]
MDFKEVNHVRSQILANAPVLHGAAPRVLHHGYSLITTQEAAGTGTNYRAALVAYSGPKNDVDAFVLRKSHKKPKVIDAMKDLLDSMELELGQRLKQTPLGGTLSQTSSRANSTASTVTTMTMRTATSTPSTPKRTQGTSRVALSEIQANAVSSSASEFVHPLPVTPKKKLLPDTETLNTLKRRPRTGRKLDQQSQGPREPITPVRPLAYSKSVPNFEGVQAKRQLFEKK